MVRLFAEMIRDAWNATLEAVVCVFRLFAFAVIFFTILWLSYLIQSDLPRYDFISITLLLIYSIFFVLRWRNSRDLLIHLVVHPVGFLFEVYKVSQLSWIYPEHGLLMLWGVPFYSGFMYTALVDFVCQFMRASKLRITKSIPWKPVMLLGFLIYLNFFLLHVTGIDGRYLLVAGSMLLLYRLPVRLTIKKTVIHVNFLVLMVVFSFMVWGAENVATFSGAWLYYTQLNGWTPVSFHKLISWYLLGQFFIFLVLYCNHVSSQLGLTYSGDFD